MRARFLYTAIVVCALIPGGGRAGAQEVSTTPTIWTSSYGYIGIENLRCDCTVRSVRDANGRMFVFRSAPMVTGVIPGSPAAGLLMRGDTITQIDGVSILTVEGARKFTNIRPGDDVNLLIRRRGNAMKVSIKAIADPGHRTYTSIVTPEGDVWTAAPFPRAPAVAPAPGVAPTPRPPRAAIAPPVWVGPGVLAVPTTDEPAEPSIPAQPAIPALPAIPTEPTIPTTPAPRALRPGAAWVAAVVPVGAPSPSGWFGFSIRCSDCGWASTGRPGDSPVWESGEAPELAMVARGSPAERAGLKAGDRLTHIDGVSILTADGRRRFGRVRPGQKVELTVRRDGRAMTRSLTLGTRPEYEVGVAAVPPVYATAPVPPSARRELRYSGKLENVTVEVFSPGGPTVERVGDTMIITTGASVVRIKVDPKKAQ